jgi:hypothetical protein
MTKLLRHSSKQRNILGAATLLFLLPVAASSQLISTYAGGPVAIDSAKAVTQTFADIFSVVPDFGTPGVPGFL